VTRAARDSLRYRVTNDPFGFHVDHPAPVFAPPARYW
jgi:hypothetical protein